MRDVVLSHGAVGALVPEPGNGVSAYASTIGNAQQDLFVQRDDNGETLVDRHANQTQEGSTSPTASQAAAAPAPCSDGNYNDSGQGWLDPYDWVLNLSTYPTNLTQAGWETSIKNAWNTWKIQDNRCGFPLNARYQESTYRGNTTLTAGISSSNNCTGKDGWNVVSAGDLAGSTYGYACTYWTNIIGRNPLNEADIKFDKVTYSWTTTYTSCSNQLDVWAGAAHEFGHAWGLNHTSGVDADHPRLVMSPILGYCAFDERLLAKGDYDGYVYIY